MKCFGYLKRRDALDFLGVPEGERAELLQRVKRLEQELRDGR